MLIIDNNNDSDVYMVLMYELLSLCLPCPMTNRCYLNMAAVLIMIFISSFQIIIMAVVNHETYTNSV